MRESYLRADKSHTSGSDKKVKVLFPHICYAERHAIILKS